MPTTVFPPAPIVFMQTTMNGLIAAGGSSTRPVAFVFNWRRTNTVPVASKAVAEAAFQASICVPICAALNVRYVQKNNAIRWANDALDQPQKFVRAVAGAVAGDSMPTYVSAYLLMSSGLRGAVYRGSKHIGPMSEADTTLGTDDVWNAACLARLNPVAAAIQAGFVDANGNPWVPVVIGGIGSVPPTTNQRTNPNTITYADVTAVSVQGRTGTLNRRKVKTL